MRKNSIKNTRVNMEVQRELSNIIRGGIKDPRVAPMTSVVAVEVAPDLKTCKAYISVFGDEKAQRVAERGRIHSSRTCKKLKHAQYPSDYICDGPVYRIWCCNV